VRIFERISGRGTAVTPRRHHTSIPTFLLLVTFTAAVLAAAPPPLLTAQTDSEPAARPEEPAGEIAGGNGPSTGAPAEGDSDTRAVSPDGGDTPSPVVDEHAGEGDQDGLYSYEEPDFGGTEVSYTMLILRTVAIMGALLIGLYLVYRLLVKKKTRIVTDSEIIRVLATYPLATNRVIQIVDIAGDILVLGVSDANINLLSRVDDQESIDRIKLLASKENQGGTTFKDQLRNLIGGKAAGRPGGVTSLSGYRTRIEKMRKL
jgi:flagellar biogenesis protein FliO